jgi:glycosyltransferase involved in cell wall biosynthesis
MDVSVVIPLLNEEESLSELTEWIKQVLDGKYEFEIIFVDDGSTDGSWHVIKQLSQQYSFVKGIRFNRNYGKSAALQVGFEKAQGDVVITMDADLQDNPDEIPELYRMIIEEKYDLVSGWKKKRYDPPSKTIPTKFFNWTVRKLSGIPLHDFNCGLKAYRREVVKSIEVYGEMHRYIPVIAKWAGFQKIGEKVVVHRPRKYGHSKFGLARFIRGPLDLITIMFVSKFGKRPMHFFGSIGTFLFLVGFFIAFYLAYAKIFLGLKKMTELPIFYLALLCMIIGSQLFIGGFLAEMIGRISPDRNKYIIRETTGND